ncbi:Telomerase reverse transcriptase [Yarrowia sp. B02]|nr:Telomerase reverse transcriptase [Yarrowia sp. B02]
MLKRLKHKLPKSDSLLGYLTKLEEFCILDEPTFQRIIQLSQEDERFGRFLSSTIIVRRDTDKPKKVVLPQYVNELSYPSFIRLLSSMSSRDSVLHNHIVGVSDPTDKPISETDTSHTAIEALCETGWRTLESLVSRYMFAKFILNHILFMELRAGCYLQVSGERIDDILIPPPVEDEDPPPKLPPPPTGFKVPRTNLLKCKQGFYYCLAKKGYSLTMCDMIGSKEEKVSVREFVEAVFPYSYEWERRPKIPKRLLAFTHIAANIMKKCESRNFLQLLDAWFPMKYEYQNGHSLNKVVSFCFAASHMLFPQELFGSAENWAVLRSKYVYYMKLPPRTPPSFDTMMEGFKLTEIDWLFTSDKAQSKSLGDSLKARELFEQIIVWITNKFLPQLFRSFFYVTDSVTSEQMIFRHAVWRRRARPALRDLKHTQFSRDIYTPSVFGVSKFRLVPKKAGFRPIVSLGRPVQDPFKGKGPKPVSVNRKLSRLHKVLYQEFKLSGRNKCGLESVHLLKRVLGNFERSVRAHGDIENLKFVKIDVTAAFDTIPPKKVREIATSLLDSVSYSIHRHTRTVPLGPKAFKRWFTTCKAINGRSESTLQFFRSMGHKGLLVDENKSSKIGKQLLCKLLNDHLFRNDVMIDGNVYRQIRGIPQGSVMSSLFCSMVYEEMVMKHFGELFERRDTCLLRYVDDFLLITADTATAVAFLHKALEGIPEYGVSVNRSKCLVNFPLTIDDVEMTRLEKGQNMPFLGMTIDPSNLQLRRQYTSSSRMLWVDHGVKLSTVRVRTLKYFKTRFPRALLDGSVPEDTVLKNVAAFFRYVFLRGLRTILQFKNLSEERITQEAAILATKMIDVSMGDVAVRCPQTNMRRLRGWLTRVAVISIERQR